MNFTQTLEFSQMIVNKLSGSAFVHKMQGLLFKSHGLEKLGQKYLDHYTKEMGWVICVSGRGWYQEWGKPAVELKPGVIIAVPEGVKHWHGAAKDSWMQHLTYHANAKPGNSNEWLEPVTDEQYNKVR